MTYEVIEVAIIQCIECGNNISSYAESCPNCGCPKNMQRRDEQDDYIAIDSNVLEGVPKLKNQDRWEYILYLAGQKRGDEAFKEITELTGKKFRAHILSDMIEFNKVPVEYILEKFPDQAATPIVKKPEPTMTTCTACSRPISVKAETCPHCGNPTGVHTCPRCGSTDWVYIDAVSKVGAMALFGAFAVNTVRNKYQCRACKFKY